MRWEMVKSSSNPHEKRNKKVDLHLTVCHTGNRTILDTVRRRKSADATWLMMCAGRTTVTCGKHQLHLLHEYVHFNKTSDDHDEGRQTERRRAMKQPTVGSRYIWYQVRVSKQWPCTWNQYQILPGRVAPRTWYKYLFCTNVCDVNAWQSEVQDFIFVVGDHSGHCGKSQFTIPCRECRVSEMAHRLC